MTSLRFNFIRLLFIVIPILSSPDLGVDVLVYFIRLSGVMHSELVGLLFKALREAVDETKESFLL